jgi:hypothetical protein
MLPEDFRSLQIPANLTHDFVPSVTVARQRPHQPNITPPMQEQYRQPFTCDCLD